jgi:hypothetical protein
MMLGGCGGDEDGREWSGRVWLRKEGDGDAIVAVVGIVVTEGENLSEIGEQLHKAREAHGLKTWWGGHGDDTIPPSTIQC